MARLSKGGRRKIELKMIENERERAVTLSKRHTGLFKKAGELATLCGVQIAIILFTISGKPLSFGSPNVINVIRKFLGTGEQKPAWIRESMSFFRNKQLQELNREFDEFNEQSVIDKKHAETLEEELKVWLDGKTYEAYKRSIGLEKLMEMKYKLQQVNGDLDHVCDAESGSLSIKDGEYEEDLSKIEGPKNYLKL